MTPEEQGGGGEEERREAAIASAPSLQPSFKPTRISQNQVSKLQELHKRRLKIKSKIHKKSYDGTRKSHGKDLKQDEGTDSSRKIEESSVTDLKNHHDSINFSAKQENVAANQAPKKRQKLYWGLDTKERWERKSNM